MNKLIVLLGLLLAPAVHADSLLCDVDRQYVRVCKDGVSVTKKEVKDAGTDPVLLKAAHARLKQAEKELADAIKARDLSCK